MRTFVAILLVMFLAACDQVDENESVKLTDPSPLNQNITATANDLEWWGNPDLPIVGWKTLVGDEGGVIPQKDVRFGTLKLEPETYYPGHKHTAPEIYYVLSGQAEWKVGDQTISATPETVIYIPPNTSHSILNSDSPLIAVWTWWAPGGDRTVFNPEGYEFTEPLDNSPAVN
ncbi:MAG: dimethylsulfonioproprionate lyase family protein [Emcibacteraceae bacterium]|nr:dimethylsulfonioproprionate lyase family protein [Emcibacteraceae bacterium]